MYRDSAHGVMKSENGGDTWDQAYTQINGELYKSREENNHAYSIGMGFHPTDDDRMFLGMTDFGFWEADNEWFRYVADCNPFESQGRGKAVLLYPENHPPNAGDLIMTTQEFNALGLVTGAMDAWDFLIEENGANDIILVSIANEGGGDETRNIGGLFLKSIDNGKTFQIIGPQCIGCNLFDNGLPSVLTAPETTFYDIERINGDLFLAAGEHGVYRSQDNGQTWQNILPSTGGDSFTHIAYKDNIIYASAGFGYFSPDSHLDGSVHRSTNNGDSGTWEEIISGVDVRGIGVTSDGAAYFTDYGNGIFKIDAGSSTAIEIQDAPGAWGLDAASDDTVYVSVDQKFDPGNGFGAGVYSYDGVSFTDITDDLPMLTMFGASMRVNPRNSKEIYVGTWGGWWKKLV